MYVWFMYACLSTVSSHSMQLVKIYDKQEQQQQKKNDESTETKEHEVQFALWM